MSAPRLSPKQVNALMHQANKQLEVEYIEAITCSTDALGTWGEVVDEYLSTSEGVKALLLKADPHTGNTIGHIAAQQEDASLWEHLLDIGESNPALFARLRECRNANNHSVDDCIRKCKSETLEEMLDEFISSRT